MVGEPIFLRVQVEPESVYSNWHDTSGMVHSLDTHESITNAVHQAYHWLSGFAVARSFVLVWAAKNVVFVAVSNTWVHHRPEYVTIAEGNKTEITHALLQHLNMMRATL